MASGGLRFGVTVFLGMLLREKVGYEMLPHLKIKWVVLNKHKCHESDFGNQKRRKFFVYILSVNYQFYAIFPSLLFK